jgi:hypothetical protein
MDSSTNIISFDLNPPGDAPLRKALYDVKLSLSLVRIRLKFPDFVRIQMGSDTEKHLRSI